MSHLSRGVAEKDADGKLKIKIPNYSYAEDGKLIWDAIHEFASGYLGLYYDDNTPGKRVCISMLRFQSMNSNGPVANLKSPEYSVYVYHEILVPEKGLFHTQEALFCLSHAMTSLEAHRNLWNWNCESISKSRATKFTYRSLYIAWLLSCCQTFQLLAGDR